MTWQSPPSATGTSTISMTAVTATDDSGPVEYSFSCVSGGAGCSSSGWQASTTFTDNGLQASTTYSYTVTGASTITMTAVTATDESGYVEYYFDSVSGGTGRNDSGWQTSPSYTDSGLQADTSYAYNVRARDAAGNLTFVSARGRATTDTTSTEDTTPPSPAQMAWQSPPTATGTSAISMTAVTATDASGSVEYSFSCVSGGTGCSSSGWQTSPSYMDSGLQASTTYSYSVTARDAAGNMNIASVTASSTTDAAADTTPPSPAQMTWQSPPNATSTSAISMTAVTATDASGSVQYSFICVSGGTGCSSSSWQTSNTFTDSGLQADTSYSYTVRARDAAGNMNNASVAASATTDAVQPPPTNLSPTAVASYSPNPARILRGKTVQVTLDGADSSDTDGSITAWSWKDQSGSVVSADPVFSAKLREGNHSYTLTVTDNQGVSDATEITVTVLGKVRQKSRLLN